MRKFLIAAIPLLLIGCTSPSRPSPDLGSQPATLGGPLGEPPGPSAAQLAHGRWVKMAAPPIRLCQPVALWDGRALVVYQGSVAQCQRPGTRSHGYPAAAAYFPRANRWARIATPPPGVGLSPLAAWGAGRLILISPRTGFVAAWSPAADRWRRLPRLPVAGAISMTWTGRTFLVIASRQGQGYGTVWSLSGDTWLQYLNLPPVVHGWYTEAPVATLDGAVYALVHEFRGSLKAHNISGSSRLLVYTTAGWDVVPVTPPKFMTAYSLTALDGRLLATGVSCGAFCMEETGEAAILRPGTHGLATQISPPGHLYLPFGAGIAAGPHAVVVTYSVGGNTLSGGDHPRAVRIYDPLTSRWLAGPTAPATPPYRAAYWTPYGVVSLGQGGGWVLRPGK